MTDLDLDAVKARYASLLEHARRVERGDAFLPRSVWESVCAKDVPLLVAEVERLRQLLSGMLG